MGGRTAILCPMYTPPASLLFSHVGQGDGHDALHSSMIPLPGRFWVLLTLTQGGSCSSSHSESFCSLSLCTSGKRGMDLLTQNALLFFGTHAASWEACSIIHDFLWMSLRILAVCMCVSITIWGSAYVFPLSRLRIGPSPPFGVCCEFVCFSRCCSGKSVAIVLSLVLGCCVCAITFWGYCWVFLAMLGPRTTLNCLVWLEKVQLLVWGCHPVVFTLFTELWTVCFTAVCSGWSSDCWELD